MGKIATNSEVNSKIGSSLTPLAKCPTKKNVLDTGLATVNGNYLDNQLVQLSDITKKIIVNYISIDFTDDPQDEDESLYTFGIMSTYPVNSSITVNWRYKRRSSSRWDNVTTILPINSDYVEGDSFKDEIDAYFDWEIISITPNSDSSFNYEIDNS